MVPIICLLITLASTAICAPSVVPEMQLSARVTEDPYDDSITIVAEPKPYDQMLDVEAAIQNSPLFRLGHIQGSTATEPYFWYPSTSTSHLGNKIFFSNLFQNLPPTLNVPNTVNTASNALSNYYTRFKEFLQQAQQNAAQFAASWQNLKGDQYYNYGLPSHPALWTVLHKPVGTWKSALPQSSDAPVVPAYQVIAVMPMYDSPPIKIADYLRQSSMNVESMRNGRSMEVEENSPVLADQVPISKMESELKKDVVEEIKKEMTNVAIMEEKEVENFAKDVAKEIASAVAEAAQKPGKLTEVVVKVDSITIDDDDDDDSSSSSSSEEDDDKTVQSIKKPEQVPAKIPTSSKVPVKNDKSDSSESSESSEVYPTLPQKTTVTLTGKQDKKKNPNGTSHQVGTEKSSEESSEYMDSVEKVAKLSMGARPLKVELEVPKVVKLPPKDVSKKTV